MMDTYMDTQETAENVLQKNKKEVLEQLRDHYYNVALDMELSEQDEKQMFYLGKHEVIVNLLKMFESLEG